MKPRQAYYILDQGEAILPTDEYFSNGGWFRTGGDSQFVRDLAYRRPIPDAPTPDDGWIPWCGGDRPVDQSVEVEYRMRDGEVMSRRAGLLYWKHHQPLKHDIIAYRIVKAPEPQWIPLGPDDVPPGSVIRGAGEKGDSGWCSITSCSLTGIRLWHHCDTNQTETKWATLMESESEIKRPGEDWQPCKKLAK